MDGFPRTTAGAGAPAAGRWWTIFAAALLVFSIGSWLYLVLALGVEGSRCFDAQGDPAGRALCEAEHRRVAGAWRLIVLVAAASAGILLLIGLLEGLRRRRYASGPRQPLRILIVVNPAAAAGYVLGRIIGRLLPPLSGRRAVQPGGPGQPA